MKGREERIKKLIDPKFCFVAEGVPVSGSMSLLQRVDSMLNGTLIRRQRKEFQFERITVKFIGYPSGRGNKWHVGEVQVIDGFKEQPTKVWKDLDIRGGEYKLSLSRDVAEHVRSMLRTRYLE